MPLDYRPSFFFLFIFCCPKPSFIHSSSLRFIRVQADVIYFPAGSLSFLVSFESLPSFCVPTISQFIVSDDETSNDMQSVFTNLMGDILFVGVDFIVNYSPKLNLHIQGSLFRNCKKKEK